jgi:hypothetical protein
LARPGSVCSYAETCSWENAYANFWNSQAGGADADAVTPVSAGVPTLTPAMAPTLTMDE